MYLVSVGYFRSAEFVWLRKLVMLSSTERNHVSSERSTGCLWSLRMLCARKREAKDWTSSPLEGSWSTE